jgi:DNA-binding response OmpR family regulator
MAREEPEPGTTAIRRLLLVDDDHALVRILAAALAEEGFAVETAANGLDGLRRFEAGAPDLVILDVLLPELDGLEVCRRIRRKSAVPIILLTSRAEEVDRVTGLDTGADDYVTKPFSTRELCARIRAIDRRLQPPAGAELLTAGPLEIDRPRFEVRWKGQLVAFTRSEFEILAALARKRGFVLSRDQVLELARGDDAAITDRTVDTFVKRIRKKLRDVDPAFDAIETVYGVGYRFST